MLFKRFLAVVLVLCAVTVAAHAQTKNLYDRLGGDRGITALVDDWYSHLVADPELSDRFAGPDKNYLKNQYVYFFTTASGGPKLYHGRDLTSVHKHLRITTEEWDLAMSHMQDSLSRLRLDPRTQRDFMNLCLGFRSQIVWSAGGPTITSPVNRSLYARMGGEAALRGVVDDFFDQMTNDPSLQDRFTGTNLAAIKSEVIKYLGQATGGPQVYSGRDMKSVHQRMHITSEEWDSAMGLLHTAMEHNNIPEQESIELTNIVTALRSQIVHQ